MTHFSGVQGCGHCFFVDHIYFGQEWVIVKVLGIDIGSSATKLIILDEAGVFFRRLWTGSENSEVMGQKTVQDALTATSLTRDDIDLIVGTGRSRRDAHFADLQKSFHICLFKGGVELFPDVRTIVDVGAENTTVIGIDDIISLRIDMGRIFSIEELIKAMYDESSRF